MCVSCVTGSSTYPCTPSLPAPCYRAHRRISLVDSCKTPAASRLVGGGPRKEPGIIVQVQRSVRKGLSLHMRQGFDNEKYIELQAANIRKRIAQFGGKLFDDYHASRVLPGFEPDSKFRMLKSLVDDVEIVIAINANHIEKAKMRGDLGITYDEDVLR